MDNPHKSSTQPSPLTADETKDTTARPTPSANSPRSIEHLPSPSPPEAPLSTYQPPPNPLTPREQSSPSLPLPSPTSAPSIPPLSDQPPYPTPPPISPPSTPSPTPTNLPGSPNALQTSPPVDFVHPTGLAASEQPAYPTPLAARPSLEKRDSLLLALRELRLWSEVPDGFSVDVAVFLAQEGRGRGGEVPRIVVTDVYGVSCDGGGGVLRGDGGSVPRIVVTDVYGVSSDVGGRGLKEDGGLGGSVSAMSARVGMAGRKRGGKDFFAKAGEEYVLGAWRVEGIL